MALSRRRFLKLVGGSTAGAAILAACRPAVREFIQQSPHNLPEDLVTGVDNWYATLCRECSAGCGVVVRIIEGRAKKIEGNPLHPINQGKLCARGQSPVQAVYHPDRIRRPMRPEGERGSRQYVEITWDEALDELTGKLGELREGGAADAVTIITDPIGGHLGGLVSTFAEAYGARHVPYEPMDQAALRMAMSRVFGQDRIPEFDLKNTSYLLSFGADFLGGWLSQVRHSRGYGEFRQGDRDRGTFVQVDTRFSTTAANADTWVPVKPGSEGKLAASLAQVIIAEGLGRSASLRIAPADLEAFSPERVADATGVSADRIRELARAFADERNQPALAIGGGSAGAYTNGSFNLAAIYALNHLVGSVGVPGGIIFNPAPPSGGPPIASGESMPFSGWNREVARMREGAVSAVLVRNADPVFGSPATLDVAGALDQVGFIASFSSFLDDTTLKADLVLPTSLPFEDWGDLPPDPGPGFQAIGIQQPVVRPFQDTRGFGDVLLALAQDLGQGGDLPWTSFRDVLREGAQRLNQLNRGSVSGATFEEFWNELLRLGGWWDEGQASTDRIVLPEFPITVPDAQFAGSPGDYPFTLVPFQSISLGDGRGAHLPWMQATPDPITTTTWETWVEVNSRVADERGLKEGDIVDIESIARTIQAAVYPNPATPPDILGVPVGQGHEAFGRWAEGRGANPLDIVDPRTDEQSGGLAWAATRVRMRPTGERIRIPKMENSVLAIDFDRSVAQITNEG